MSFPDLLGRGIEQVSRMHAGVCDLRHPATPSATMIVARQRGGTLECLVSCDSVLLLLRRAGEPSAVTGTQLEETWPGSGQSAQQHNAEAASYQF